MKLSIIMPVYNEKNNILKILKKVDELKIPGVEKELIIVDDFSTDGTREILKKIKNHKIIYHEKNQGKGAALRTGFKHATGDIITIQDADLEYEPEDLKKLVKQITSGKTKVVYGSRFIHPDFKPAYRLFYLGNKFLSFLTRILYFTKITDMETCYKMFKKECIKGMIMRAKGFDFEPEITAKLIRRGYSIIEIPISYYGRPHNEGKKLKPFKDGIKALWYLIKYRFVD